MFNLEAPCSPRRRKTPSSMSSPRHSKISSDVVSPNDRFIPSRSGIDFEVSKYHLNDLENDELLSLQSPTSPSQLPQSQTKETEFEYRLRNALLESPTSSRSHSNKKQAKSFSDSPSSRMSGLPRSPRNGLAPRVLNFSSSDIANSSQSLENEPLFEMLNNHKSGMGVGKKGSNRVIQSSPSRILDAPDIVDDYYLNLISWSASNVLAVALGPSIYTWNADKNSVQQICTLEHGNIVTSVAWASMGMNGEELLAVGCNSAEIQIWDANTQKLVRTLPGHSARVSSLSWNPTSSNMLSSGSRDAKIFNHDIRISRPMSGMSNGGSGVVSTLLGHKQEVCGLKWNHSGNTLASGGNENYLCIWDVANSGQYNYNNGTTDASSSRSVSPRLILTDHKAAVKALAWAPFKSSLLASGGGTADRCIKYWNVNTGNMVSSTDTGSQVCSLLWSPNRKEIVSGHGFSQNQLVLWKYPTMTKLMEFTGHTARVLHLDQSPDGTSIVSAGADETLRFWKIFGSSSKRRTNHSSMSSAFETVEPVTIR